MTYSRRELLKVGGAALIGSSAIRNTAAYGQLVGQQCSTGSAYYEVYPTSPFIMEPFQDDLPIPAPLKPEPALTVGSWGTPPAPNCQNSDDGMPHQIWPSQLGLPDPIVYRIALRVAPHQFTKSKVKALKALPQRNIAAGQIISSLPASTIYGFNGTFPGPMIYAKYGQPLLVRFVNELDDNPYNLSRGNFGHEEFLTHLHNGHTAPESDGNPNHRPHAWECRQWVDNLYLNWPAGGDDREAQSFLWFHDHTHDHTGANVYKGMVGLYPIYDANDSGDERKGWRLPGVPNPVTGRVDYDIPLALYDCCLDDGITQHKDFHSGQCETHPEWWGQSFFKHFPNHGFVGDIFTVNGKAYPVLRVKRRKYRLRFLGASIARCYDISLMKGAIAPFEGQQGQWNFVESMSNPKRTKGQQCMKMIQIATDGGLLPAPIVRDRCEIWPGKRREFIVDFSKYQDGSPTRKGDVIYLANTMKMANGRKPNNTPTTRDDFGNIIQDLEFDPDYCVPMMKIIIEDDKPPADNSLIPNRLRSLPPVPWGQYKRLPSPPPFRLERSGTAGGETEWLINGKPFDAGVPLAYPKLGSAEVWTVQNGGGGWTHPMHFHQEEHFVVERNGVPTPNPADPRHVDDMAKEDLIALDPGEEVKIYRKFRTFTGNYVAHCHNLAHEDHAMMFGFRIIP